MGEEQKERGRRKICMNNNNQQKIREEQQRTAKETKRMFSPLQTGHMTWKSHFDWTRVSQDLQTWLLGMFCGGVDTGVYCTKPPLG